ncbi:hypothetical protein [Methylocystis sp. B8]|uniref:hypothetical protein n=1 Tax=Methylocystis sp. B8 TaxID=544938 RepID=UPI0010FDA443|nr:hypothetical protein [Methylocystis sp. B8]TLG79246.1 hypothetical protein FEV16_04370 [Methylocystis sp. B8]
MNKLLIAALALGAAGFVNSAISAPAIARLTPGDEALTQKADDRDRDLKDDQNDHPGYWGRNPSWRDTRPWSDDEWRRGRDWDDNRPGMDDHD